MIPEPLNLEIGDLVKYKGVEFSGKIGHILLKHWSPYHIKDYYMIILSRDIVIPSSLLTDRIVYRYETRYQIGDNIHQCSTFYDFELERIE